METKLYVKTTLNNLRGEAEVMWLEANEYNAAHYEAFISVPYQPSRWVNLFISDKHHVKEAMDKAQKYLELALQRCTLC